MMKRIFDMDNPLMKALGTAADLLVLNLLTLLCSIPVVTAGAAYAALNDVLVRIIRGEETYIIRGFFHAFAANLKQGTLLGLLCLGTAGIIYLDYLAATAYAPGFRAVVVAVALLVLSVALYAFALLSRYENTLGGTLKNAASLVVAFFPRTVGMLICTVGVWLLAYRYLNHALPLLLMFGFSLPCYVCLLLMNGIFQKLEQRPPA